MTYQAEFEQALRDPEGFWREAAEAIRWTRAPQQILDASRAPFYRWYADGELNTADNCLDRHVEAGRGDVTALIHDSPVTNSQQRYSYVQLRDAVAKFAGVIRNQGVEKGDRVIIYMPMIPEAVIAMLACARIGAVHSVVFGGFAGAELAKRIDDATPKLVLSASCGIEPTRIVEYKPLLDRGLELAEHKVERCVIFQRETQRCELTPGRDLDWTDALADAEPADCVPVAATDPLYILYTSGTTGKPKGVVRDNGGHAVAMHYSMRAVYGLGQDDVFWTASDVGWVVGHSYIVYAPLLLGCTSVMYEGKPVGTPDAGAFFRVIAEHGVDVFFTAPTAFRAIKKVDPNGELAAQYDVSSLRALFLAGEHTDPDTARWAGEKLNVPVVDHWWQTETAWPMSANPLGIEQLDVPSGSAGRPVPGYDTHVLAPDGEEVPHGEMGDICVKLPLPPGCFPTLWQNDERYKSSYLEQFPGYYRSGDAGYLDADGNLWVMSRVDDIINVAGHRLSTGMIEEVIAAHADVAEAAVVGAADADKGQLPVAMVVLKSSATRGGQEIVAELVAHVRDQIGPVAAFRHVAIVERLPKTRSGKVVRATLREIADGKDWTTPATIDDPAILTEIEAQLGHIGYAKRRAS
ncbi:acyl-CoA synthetase/AMP-acid ligase [Salinisphaera shabanensis T35B1]|uniref:AMP-binding protein n=1 Tax=Salinisphaera shabanensis TaxID=180542 RepID=UPI00333FAC34